MILFVSSTVNEFTITCGQKNARRGQLRGRRVFGVVLRGNPDDFQRWLEAAKPE